MLARPQQPLALPESRAATLPWAQQQPCMAPNRAPCHGGAPAQQPQQAHLLHRRPVLAGRQPQPPAVHVRQPARELLQLAQQLLVAGRQAHLHVHHVLRELRRPGLAHARRCIKLARAELLAQHLQVQRQHRRR